MSEPTHSEQAIQSIKTFLATSGVSNRALARASGVSERLIRRLLNGELDHGTLGKTRQIEEAMRQWTP